MSFPGSVFLSEKQIRETTSDQRLPLGTRGYTRDGRVFRYAKNGATKLTAGKLVQATVPIWATAQLHFKTIPTSNSTKITIASTASAKVTSANYFAEGFLSVSTAGTTQDGQYVYVKSHTKTTATLGAVYITPYEGSYFKGTLTTANKLNLVNSPFKNVVISRKEAAPTSMFVGVSTYQVPANYYCWLQTWGACNCKQDGATAWVAGARLIPSATDVGALAMGTSVGVAIAKPSVGQAMVVGTDAKYGMAFLTIAP
jgi:hypothetical protein